MSVYIDPTRVPSREEMEKMLKDLEYSTPTSKPQIQYSHYKKDITNLKTLDIYRILRLYNVIDPSIAHAVKKLLCAGGRGTKDKNMDVQEAIASLNRYLDMEVEDGIEKE